MLTILSHPTKIRFQFSYFRARTTVYTIEPLGTLTDQEMWTEKSQHSRYCWLFWPWLPVSGRLLFLPATCRVTGIMPTCMPSPVRVTPRDTGTMFPNTIKLFVVAARKTWTRTMALVQIPVVNRVSLFQESRHFQMYMSFRSAMYRPHLFCICRILSLLSRSPLKDPRPLFSHTDAQRHQKYNIKFHNACLSCYRMCSGCNGEVQDD